MAGGAPHIMHASGDRPPWTDPLRNLSLGSAKFAVINGMWGQFCRKVYSLLSMVPEMGTDNELLLRSETCTGVYVLLPGAIRHASAARGLLSTASARIRTPASTCWLCVSTSTTDVFLAASWAAVLPPASDGSSSVAASTRFPVRP